MAGTTTYKELDEIRAPADIRAINVKAGDRGVVVEVLEHPERAILVEYSDGEGQTKGLVYYSPGLEKIFSIAPELD